MNCLVCVGADRAVGGVDRVDAMQMIVQWYVPSMELDVYAG